MKVGNRIFLHFFLLFLFASTIKAQTKTVGLNNLSANQKLNGFTAKAVYLNESDQPMGGRFIHDRTGFTLDLLQIESVPQTFIWVNTFPVSDKGEPHTQEHLLITKGHKGHALNTREEMSLASSNAYTSQLHTAYHFYTGAGNEVFFTLFEGYIDALLHPDYTEEEVRREVRNWGIAETPGEKTLRIEEKGSVYNEMTVSMGNPYSQLYLSLNRMLYGVGHPLSYNAGGLPEAIREMTPADIKKFHESNYHLGNMGAITSLPKNISLANILSKTNSILNKLEPSSKKLIFKSKEKMQSPSPAKEGSIAITEYPSEHAQEPGNMMFAYPAKLDLDAKNELFLKIFLNTVAGDASTNLYKIFVDTKTRQLDLGAQSIYGYVDEEKGQPIIFGLTGISAANLTEEKVALARSKIMEELKGIASLPANSLELKEFNSRFLNNLIDERRSLSKFINTPPKFGFRTTYDGWHNQLEELEKIKDFKKSIVLKNQFSEIEKSLKSNTNIWKELIHNWGLDNTTPYALVSKANPALIAGNEKAKKERAKQQLAVLKTKYNVKDDQEAIKNYKAEYDKNTEDLEKSEQAYSAKFIDNPPLTLDDQLNFKEKILSGNVKLVSSTFNNMTSATTGIAFKLDAIPADKLVYLAILPELFTQVGLYKNGQAIFYETMAQKMQQEILSLESYYATNLRTGRVELVVKGAGNNPIEAQRAVDWMNDVLQHPFWKKENLSRITDLVDQNLSGIRTTMQGAEENWVTDPADAYLRQDNPLILSTSSFLSRAFSIFRLRWLLKDAGDEKDAKAIDSYLASMSKIKAERAQLKSLVAALQTGQASAENTPDDQVALYEAFNNLPATAKKIVGDAAKDLEQLLNDIPDGSLSEDWTFLCNQIKKDLAQDPATTLSELDAVRKVLLQKANARMFVIASDATQQKLSVNMGKLVSNLGNATASSSTQQSVPLIGSRIQARYKAENNPVFVGLVNPNSQTGVFINSAPLITYRDTSREQLLNFLSAQLFAGGGKQSVFSKSIGAGLAYSNGVGASPASGRFRYYAERTPELPQTLKYVIDEVKKSQKDESMRDYVISLSVGSTRAASDYEIRGEAMAADIADGITPAVVRNFRSSILKLRNMNGLVDELYKRKDAVYQLIFPGYGKRAEEVSNGLYFVIGNENQMKAYEAYLKAAEGKDTKLFRAYPRDFWMIN